MAQLNFNAANVAPAQSTSPVPAGLYNVQVTESDIKAAKSGGQYLALTLQVLDGQYINRKIWTNLTISNSNSEAERIGQQQLSALCHAAGVINLQDSNQLHFKPLRVKVVIKENAQYGDRNEVKGFEALAAGTLPITGAVPASNAPAAATAPWQQRKA